MSSNEDELIESLILQGALEVAGVDSENGETLYKPTQRLKEIDSKLSNELSIYFSEVTLKLWEKSFLDMDVTDRDPLVKLGPRSFDALAIKSLPKDERVVMEEIVKALFNKN